MESVERSRGEMRNQSKILEIQKLFSGFSLSLSSVDEKAALEAVDDTIFAGFMRSQGLENLDEETSKKLKMFLGDYTLFMRQWEQSQAGAQFAQSSGWGFQLKPHILNALYQNFAVKIEKISFFLNLWACAHLFDATLWEKSKSIDFNNLNL